jgi:FkbM family methyltransferase
MRNWPLYFKRKYFKSDRPAVYVFRGGGIKIQVPDLFFYVFKEVIMEDFYQIEDLLPHIPEKPVIVDIGANAGYFSFLMAAKREHAAIYAYEPIQNNIDVFSANLELNAGSKNSVKLEHKAVTGAEKSSVTLFFDAVNHDTVVSSVFEDFSPKNIEAVEVNAISLAGIIRENKLTTIDVLKLDCEGSEYPILYDSPEATWPLIKCLCIEVHELDKEKRNHNYLSAFLQQKGFLLTSRLDINGCYYVMAWR